MNIDSPEERTVLHYQLHRQVDLSYYLSGKNNATKRILYIVVDVSNFLKKMSKGYIGTMYFREKKILLMGRLLVYCCVVN